MSWELYSNSIGSVCPSVRPARTPSCPVCPSVQVYLAVLYQVSPVILALQAAEKGEVVKKVPGPVLPFYLSSGYCGDY